MAEHGERTTLAIALRAVVVSLTAKAIIVGVEGNNWNVTKQSFFVTWAIARLRIIVSLVSLFSDEVDVFGSGDCGDILGGWEGEILCSCRSLCLSFVRPNTER